MEFIEQRIKGCYIIKRAIPKDSRGYFVRLVDVEEFRKKGIDADFVQISLSQNYKKGTLRGMHSQVGNDAEDKLVVCSQGEVFDVCLDVRKDSPTYLQYCSAVLSEDNGQALYIPKGCAHGFYSLKDNSQLIYFMTTAYNGSAEKGYKFDDPAFSIDWPGKPVVISDKDSNWPLIGD